MLVDHADALRQGIRRRVEVAKLPADKQRAGIRAQEPVENFGSC